MTRPLSLAAAALAALALAACGGDDGGGDGGRPPQQVVDSGRPAEGREVYAANCAACHGGDGGGGTGPRLAGEEAFANPDVVVEQVREGGGGMPSFSGRLSEQELADVSAFVVRELAR